MTKTSAVRQRLLGLPKAEFHVHLEGCLSKEQILSLAEAAGEPLRRPADDQFTFANLAEFLGLLDWSCSLVK